jgi:6-phosphogluconolactonase (cycloisomerase 2 family)
MQWTMIATGRCGDGWKMRVRALCAAVCVAALPAGARAACNLIPAAEKTFLSTLGRIDSPITAPGKTVEIELKPACDGTSPGFDTGTPANNIVTVRFQPPGGGATTDVVVSPVEVVDALKLRFSMPDTTTALPPHGLAGPATIRVEHATTTDVLAEIGPLFQPTSGCDKEPETVFEQFTVLPPANVVADLINGTATQIRATLDGGNDILVPMNWVAVLPLGAAAPVARLLEGQSGIEAFPGGGTAIVVPDESFVRAFTLDGRPLPPLLRVNDAGDEFYGTADAEESVLRIARNDGMGGGGIYDFTTRLFMGRGPIVIDKTTDGFTVTSREAIPLEGLQSSPEAVAFARPESLEGDLNGDSDATDQVVQIVDVGTGVGTNTGKAVVTIATDAFAAPEIVTEGPLVAFLESEAAQSVDYTGDGDFEDAILRVYDNTGTELTAGLDTEVLPRRLVNERTLAISDGFVFFRTPDANLGWVTTLLDGFRGTQLPGGSGTDVILSPDGRFLYSTDQLSDSLSVFQRDPTSGLLTFVEIHTDEVDGVDGLSYPFGGGISPDGKHLYISAQGATSSELEIGIFERDQASGKLTFVGTFSRVDCSSNCLWAPAELAVSPDGTHLYVASWDEALSSVDVFSRDPVTGLLTYVESQYEGVNGVTGLDSPLGVTLSPDGAHVYVTGWKSHSLAVFERDNVTGELTFLEAHFDGVNGVDGLARASEVTVSADGEYVYVASGYEGGGDDAVAVFERNTTTGALTFVEAEFQGVNGVDGLERAKSVKISPDGTQVFARGWEHIARFERDASTGELTFAEAVDAGCGGLGNGSLDVSPEGTHLYTGCGGISVFEFPGGRLRVFNSATQTLQPGADILAGALSVAAESAAFLRPDAFEGGNKAGRPFGVYHAVLDDWSDASIAVSMASSSELVAWIEYEDDLVPNVDFNGDGDVFDMSLMVTPQGVYGHEVTGLVAEDISVSGTTVAFLTSEASDGDADLNGDLDTTDRVVRLFEDTTDTTTNLGEQAEEFVLRGDLLAFRTSEAAQGNTDLNGDGDTLDAVMRVYQLSTDTLFDVAQAASICDIPGCDPFLPYKVRGDTVSFITREPEQGNTDLNGDGDAVDTVMQVFNVVSGTLQVFDLGDQCQDTTTVTRFPETFVDESVLFVEQSEIELGMDLNGDGDALDCVTLVSGDKDDDGTFDDFDTCVDAPNPDQQDLDADGLGTVCDPAFSCTAMPKTGCRTPVVDLKSTLILKDKTPDTKDLLVWKWVKGAETSFADFGDPSGTDSYTLCLYDASGPASVLRLATAVPAGETCGGQPCWAVLGSNGYRYKDVEHTPDGILKALLKSGEAGKAKIVLKGKGENIPALPLLPLALPVRVQLQSTAGACWESGFDAAGQIKNDPTQFKGKATPILPL